MADQIALDRVRAQITGFRSAQSELCLFAQRLLPTLTLPDIDRVVDLESIETDDDTALAIADTCLDRYAGKIGSLPDGLTLQPIMA